MCHLAIAFAEPVGRERSLLARYTPHVDLLRPVLTAPVGRSAPRPVAMGVSETHLYLATGPRADLEEPEPGLLIFRRSDLELEARYRPAWLAGVRGLQGEPGRLLMSSSDAGELIVLRAHGPHLGPQRFAHRPTFGRGHAGRDLGLRAVARHGHDTWMTAAGPTGGGGPGAGGFVMNVTRASIELRGLREPGAMLSRGDGLWVTEAGRCRLLNARNGRAVALPGRPAGLAALEGLVYTTLELDGQTVLCSVDLEEGGVRELAVLAEEAVEIAGLVAVEDAGNWPTRPDDRAWIECHGLMLEGEPV